MNTLSIVIPAYNEENRIERTLRAYHAFFSEQQDQKFELLVVLNGCKDNTIGVVTSVKQALGDTIRIINLKQAGKGLAIKTGFADALTRNNDLIGFVDADMATAPQAFYDLINNIQDYDGIIASRYMSSSQIFPKRPFYKEWGRKIVYHSIVRLLFGLNYYDYQCGAKVFKRPVIEKITPLLTVRQWAFDVELLYLCKKFKFKIREYPTVWHDQVDSKLTLRGGMRMLSSLFKLRFRHSPF